MCSTGNQSVFLWNNQHVLLVECYLYNDIIFQIIRVLGGGGGGGIALARIVPTVFD